MGIIWYNGIPSTDMGIVVEHPPGYQIPVRDYDVFSIPGRNGDVFVDKGTFRNTTRTYDIAIAPYQARSGHHEEWSTVAERVSEWLHSGKSTYSRLEDSYDADYYRLAAYEETVEIENILNVAGRAKLVFNCKPQRFLKVGDEPIVLTGTGKTFIIENPTNFTSIPIITLHGRASGQIVITNRDLDDSIYFIEVKQFPTQIKPPSLTPEPSPIVIDSEIQDVYGSLGDLHLNYNSSVALDRGFPKFAPGRIDITFYGGITSVEVVPKWWKL